MINIPSCEYNRDYNNVGRKIEGIDLINVSTINPAFIICSENNIRYNISLAFRKFPADMQKVLISLGKTFEFSEISTKECYLRHSKLDK